MARQERKLEHLWHAVRSDLAYADFHDVHLIHNCLPETALAETDLSTEVAGIPLANPLYINAITGGVEDAESINRNLAEVAKECNLALAVGSQMAALEHAEYIKTFQVVRQTYQSGVIFANIGAYAGPELARRAIDMVEANALQIHLNIPQELMMAEGDTDFRGYRKNIEKIVASVSVPVIVKEVGFGIAKEQARILHDLGVAALDVSGRGGTNFLQIERRRAHLKVGEDILQWGIPTPLAILEARTGAPTLDVVASGGVNSATLAAKSFALGASAVAVAGLAVKILLSEGQEALKKRLQRILSEIRMIMVMTGSTSVAGLKKVPLVLTGEVKEWADTRQLHR